MMKLEYVRLLLLPLHLLLCIPALWAQATAGAPASQRPGCPTKCGDVDIPFPFGVEENCALNAGFQLYCDTVKGKAFFNRYSNYYEVTNVSVPDGKASMKLPISTQCYSPKKKRMEYWDARSDFNNTPYWISELDNKIIVIGCRTLAYLICSSYVIGCSSTCNGTVIPQNGICSGAGCCQVDVPKDIRCHQAYFNEDFNTIEIWQQSPCGYMALMEKAAFSFNTSYLTSTVFFDAYNGKAPAVMNWQVGQVTCDEARKNMSSYACVSRGSECLNTTNEPGYRCKCSDGYEGNPYIPDGCQDIDECDRHKDSCSDICTNTAGSFNCSCRQGYFMMNNTSCEPILNSTNSAPAGQKSGFPVIPVVGGFFFSSIAAWIIAKFAP